MKSVKYYTSLLSGAALVAEKVVDAVIGEVMETWFAQYPEAGAGESARKRALETVQNNIRWASTQKPAVVDWLKSHLK